MAARTGARAAWACAGSDAGRAPAPPAPAPGADRGRWCWRWRRGPGRGRPGPGVGRRAERLHRLRQRRELIGSRWWLRDGGEDRGEGGLRPARARAAGRAPAPPAPAPGADRGRWWSRWRRGPGRGRPRPARARAAGRAPAPPAPAPESDLDRWCSRWRRGPGRGRPQLAPRVGPSACTACASAGADRRLWCWDVGEDGARASWACACCRAERLHRLRQRPELIGVGGARDGGEDRGEGGLGLRGLEPRAERLHRLRQRPER